MTQARHNGWRRIMKYVIPLIVSVGLCYFLFTGVDVEDMWAQMRTCRFQWLLFSLVFGVAAMVWRAFRWRLQLSALGIDVPVSAMINSIFGTYAVNVVFPRLGEVWRTGYIANLRKASFPTVLGSMIADRLADTVTVFLITVMTFFVARGAIVEFIGRSDVGAKLVGLMESPWLWGGALVLLALVLLLAYVYRRTAFVVRIRKALGDMWRGFAGIASMRHKGRFLVYTILIWASYFVEMLIAFYAFPALADVVSDYSVVVALVAFVFGSLAMAIPSNGGIGPWQGAVVLALAGIYGVDYSVSLAFANLVLGVQTLLIVLLGLYAFASIAVERRRIPG